MHSSTGNSSGVACNGGGGGLSCIGSGSSDDCSHADSGGGRGNSFRNGSSNGGVIYGSGSWQ